jgi:superoxide dismutase, Cu-Zn family
MKPYRLSFALYVVILSACASTQTSQTGTTSATATVRNSSGTSLGLVRLESVAGGVRLTGELTGLAPGAHGVHLHTIGRCDAPAFTSAGDHFNPRNARHGLANPEGQHAGDMPAIAADASGRAVVDHTTALVTLTNGATSLFDADGSAIVVHASSDDQRTDPSGNSGSRIACGVLDRS